MNPKNQKKVSHDASVYNNFIFFTTQLFSFIYTRTSRVPTTLYYYNITQHSKGPLFPLPPGVPFSQGAGGGGAGDSGAAAASERGSAEAAGGGRQGPGQPPQRPGDGGPHVQLPARWRPRGPGPRRVQGQGLSVPVVEGSSPGQKVVDVVLSLCLSVCGMCSLGEWTAFI